MIRPRIFGGCITIDQLEIISDTAKKYGGNQIRFTSRQEIQLLSVKKEVSSDVLEELSKAGLTTKATNDQWKINVACSPLSGVAEDEAFDVTPYMQAVVDLMMKVPRTLNSPKKYKIAFSNNFKDTANATIADIGFIAKTVNGKRGFEVYGAGGLGKNPRVGIKLEEFIEDIYVLNYVQAMKQLFEREGDGNDRRKARLRFVLKSLGEEKFIEKFKNELNKVKSEKNLELNIKYDQDKIEKAKKVTEKDCKDKYGNRIINQKQEGYYSVHVHPTNGNISINNLEDILKFIRDLDYAVSIRLNLTQGFFVRDLNKLDAEKLVDLTSYFSSKFSIDNSVVCAGARICKFGINNSQALLYKLIETFKDKSFEIKNALPEIIISGCSNSCAQPQKSIIGLIGKKRYTEDGLVPVYSILFNEKIGRDAEKLGEIYGEVPAKKIPSFFEELAKLKVEAECKDFGIFIENKEREIKVLVKKHSYIDGIKEKPDIYSDFE